MMNFAKRFLYSLPVLLCLLFMGTDLLAQNRPAPRPISGNGKVSSDKRKTDDFKSLDIKGDFDVVVTFGKRPSLQVEADDNLQSIVMTGVEENTLVVKLYRPYRSTQAVKLHITVEELEKVKLHGGARLVSEENWSKKMLKSEELQLVLEGGAKADLVLDSMNVRVQAGGGSIVNLKGNSDRAILDVSSGSTLSAGELKVYQMHLEASSGSSVKVSVNKEFKVNVNSGATVFYDGRPEINQTVSGGGKLRRI